MCIPLCVCVCHIYRVASRDAGKAMLDAIMGEIIVTCEKIHWLCREGEQWLEPDKRSPGIMSFYKKARVEYHPVGVVSAAYGRVDT